MIENVVVVMHDGVGAFGLGVASEVFGHDRTGDGLPRVDFALVADRPGTVVTDGGWRVEVDHGLERTETADLVILPGWESTEEPSPELLDALRAVVARGGRLMSHCAGAFLLAATGLADGRRVATHWSCAEELARRYPDVVVDPDVLYVDEDPIFSSAGTAAGIDACLHLVRGEHGTTAANALARRMVVPPHREGGQAQFVTTAVPVVADDARLHETLTWALQHLERDLSVDVLASRALMSPRSFARRFRAATGSSPHAWLLSHRTARAQELLERSSLPVDAVARHAGFSSPVMLRHHFAQRLGTSPGSYRRAFRGRESPAGGAHGSPASAPFAADRRAPADRRTGAVGR